jgi:hypothetical protein
MTDTETKILAFRQIVSSLKKNILEKVTLQTQKVNQIQEVQKIFKEIYHTIRKVIEKKEPISTLEPLSLDLLFRDFFEKKLSEDDKELMMYYLRRDLITFPFTVDTFHINSNLVENTTPE